MIKFTIHDVKDITNYQVQKETALNLFMTTVYKSIINQRTLWIGRVTCFRKDYVTKWKFSILWLHIKYTIIRHNVTSCRLRKEYARIVYVSTLVERCIDWDGTVNTELNYSKSGLQRGLGGRVDITYRTKEMGPLERRCTLYHTSSRTGSRTRGGVDRILEGFSSSSH